MLRFLSTVKHQPWPCKTNMELLQARHHETGFDRRWEVHHDTVLRANIRRTGCLWYCQQLGVPSSPFPVPSSRGLSILLFLADGCKRYNNTRAEPGVAISSSWCYLHLFLPFHFVIFSHFAVLRKLLMLILFIVLLWPEPHDLTLEGCFSLAVLAVVVWYHVLRCWKTVCFNFILFLWFWMYFINLSVILKEMSLAKM